jgi:hypothetical protein
MKSGVVVCLCVVIVACVMAAGCSQQPGASGSPEAVSTPLRDISGVWLGAVVPREGKDFNQDMTPEPVPPMTPWGQAFFDAVKPFRGPRAVPIAQATDPLVTCDPLGVPRSVIYETRGIAFEHVQRRTLQLLQYQRIWREIWTDGRSLPTNVGAPGADTLDPRYYGYSVGAWADDYTFVVRTTGFDERAWADELGYPRSMNAIVEERYRRIDHDTLELTVTIDDPKAYTKPFVTLKHEFTWAPTQELEEQLCIPSDALEYHAAFSPAGAEK